MQDKPRCSRIKPEELARRSADLKADHLARLAASNGPLPAVGSHLADRLEQVLDYFLPRFVQANQSAKKFQKSYTMASASVFLLGFFAVFVVTTQYLFHLPHAFLVGEVVSISLILIIFHWGNRSGWHRNRVDCRYLAERLRTGILVSFLSGRTSAGFQQDWADGLARDSWCADEFLDIMAGRPLNLPPPRAADLPVLKEFMARHWLRDQMDYHRQRAKIQLRRHRTVSTLGEIFFWLTFVAALLHLTPHQWRHAAHAEHILTDQGLTWLVIVLPAMGTAFAGLRSHFEFKKMSVRSELMARRLDELLQEVEKVDDFEGLAHMVNAAEELFSQEVAGWFRNAGFQIIPAEG